MISGFTRRHGATLFLATLCSSCEEPESTDTFEPLPIRYVTNELEIATSFDEPPLCEGDLRWLDTHVRRVEDFLGLPGEHVRTLYIYNAEAIFDEHENVFQVPGCARNLTGCFRRDKDVALGDAPVLPHELVHAVSVDLGDRPHRFWNEGLAEALSLHAIEYVPSELAQESMSSDFRYQIPGHFVRWLIDWRGVETFVRLFQGEDFGDLYGTELEAVEQIYDAEAPEVMASPFACQDETTIPPNADGSFNLAARVGCSEPTTTQIRYGFSPGVLAVAAMIDVTEPTTYALSVEGAKGVYIGGCQTEAGDRIDQLGDVVNETWLAPVIGLNYPIGTGFEPGEEVSLVPWTYRVIVVAEDMGEPVDVHLRMTPE